MRLFATSVLIFVLTFAPATRLLAQQQDPRDDDVIVVGSNEILLDAVVKDKKGHVVKDLKPSDVEVYEDGVRQEVKSFRLVTRGPAVVSDSTSGNNEPTASNETTTPRPASAPTRPAPASATRFSAVALVFD